MHLISEYFYTLNRPVHTEKSPGARSCVALHPVCAQNKCLISNADSMIEKTLKMHPKESLLRKTQGIWKSFQNTGNFVCSSYQFLGSKAKMKYIVIFAGQFYNIFSQGLNVFAKSKPHMKQWEITEICKGKMWLDRDIRPPLSKKSFPVSWVGKKKASRRSGIFFFP